MCPLICSIKKRGGEFANIIMHRIFFKNWGGCIKTLQKIVWKMYAFNDFASEWVYYNVNTCRGEREKWSPAKDTHDPGDKVIMVVPRV